MNLVWKSYPPPPMTPPMADGAAKDAFDFLDRRVPPLVVRGLPPVVSDLFVPVARAFLSMVIRESLGERNNLPQKSPPSAQRLADLLAHKPHSIGACLSGSSRASLADSRSFALMLYAAISSIDSGFKTIERYLGFPYLLALFL